MLRLISIMVVSLVFIAGNADAQDYQPTDQSVDDTVDSTAITPPNSNSKVSQIEKEDKGGIVIGEQDLNSSRSNVSQIEKEDEGGVVIGTVTYNSTRSNQSTSVAPVITDSTDVVDEQDSSSTKPVPPNPRTTRSKKTAPVDD